ncbi:unnamed protein product [Lampetra fluviatilis]
MRELHGPARRSPLRAGQEAARESKGFVGCPSEATPPFIKGRAYSGGAGPIPHSAQAASGSRAQSALSPGRHVSSSSSGGVGSRYSAPHSGGRSAPASSRQQLAAEDERTRPTVGSEERLGPGSAMAAADVHGLVDGEVSSAP